MPKEFGVFFGDLDTRLDVSRDLFSCVSLSGPYEDDFIILVKKFKSCFVAALDEHVQHVSARTTEEARIVSPHAVFKVFYLHSP